MATARGNAVLGTVRSSFFAASPAMASIADCGTYPGTICLVENQNWTGQIWRQYPDQINGCRSLSPEGFNDKASRAVNNNDYEVILYLYENSNCTGRVVTVNAGISAQLWLLSPSFDNKASAIKVVLL
jgi:hypothetical protein